MQFITPKTIVGQVLVLALVVAILTVSLVIGAGSLPQ